MPPSITLPASLPAAIPNARASSILTIASGAITPTRQSHIVAAESGTADDLVTVTTTNFQTGDTIKIVADTGDTITVKASGGNITTDTGNDITLDAASKYCWIHVTASGVVASLGGGGAASSASVFNVDDQPGGTDLARMQAALAAAKAAGGGIVSFTPGATYSVNGASTQALLIDSNNIIIEGNGATLAATDSAAFYHFIRAYVADGSATTLSASSARGAVDITVASASGLAVNDLIRIDQDKTAGGVTFVMTHWARIAAIVSTTLTLDSPLPFAADHTATTKAVTKVVPLQNVHIRNLVFDNSGVTVSSGTPQGVVLMQNCAYSSAENLRFIGADKGIAFQTFYGYRNRYENISSFKGGGGTNNDADIQIGREGFVFADNLRSESSQGFGITFHRCSNAFIGSMHCNNTLDARGIKLETVVASSGGDWHNSYAGTTGVMFARYTSYNSFDGINSQFNGTKTGATGDEYGVWFDDAENVYNVLSNVVSTNNGDADLFIHTSSVGNVINGLQVTAASKIVMNEQAQLTDVRIGAGASYGVFGHDDSASVGPEFNIYRRSASPAASDNLGIVRFMGNDAAGNPTPYGYIYASITDPTNGSEDGVLKLGAIAAGAASDRFNISAGLYASGLADMGAGTGNFSEIYKNGVAIGGVTNPLNIVLSDDGAGSGPELNLQRVSASPTNGDNLGIIRFRGRDDAGNTDPYAYIVATIVDATSGSEDATLQFGTAVAGAFATRGYFQAGLVVGSPTGADKGVGTINAAGDVYKNNSPYTNPDYVFEHYFTGKIERFAASEGAQDYRGLMPIADLGAHVKNHLRLPGITDDPAGAFRRSDLALEKIEELSLYLLQLHDRLKRLEGADPKTPEGQAAIVDRLTRGDPEKTSEAL